MARVAVRVTHVGEIVATSSTELMPGLLRVNEM
jgi:hypothetical protein